MLEADVHSHRAGWRCATSGRGGRCPSCPPYGVSVHRSLPDAAVVAEVRERVPLVMTWPVNDERALEAVLRIGVTGVISDEADILRAVIGERTSG